MTSLIAGAPFELVLRDEGTWRGYWNAEKVGTGYPDGYASFAIVLDDGTPTHLSAFAP